MPFSQSDSDKAVRAEMYAWMMSELIKEAYVDGYFFEVARGEGDEMAWIDINWKTADGKPAHRSIWEES